MLHVFLSFAVLFFKIEFSKNSFKHSTIMSNSFKIKPTFSEVTYIKNIRFSLLEMKYVMYMTKYNFSFMINTVKKSYNYEYNVYDFFRFNPKMSSDAETT